MGGEVLWQSGTMVFPELSMLVMALTSFAARTPIAALRFNPSFSPRIKNAISARQTGRRFLDDIVLPVTWIL